MSDDGYGDDRDDAWFEYSRVSWFPFAAMPIRPTGWLVALALTFGPILVSAAFLRRISRDHMMTWVVLTAIALAVASAAYMLVVRIKGRERRP